MVIDSSEVGMRKPDPRIFALVLDRLGVRAGPGRLPRRLSRQHRRGPQAAACTASWSTADYELAIAELDAC